jgi:hypothetical protein
MLAGQTKVVRLASRCEQSYNKGSMEDSRGVERFPGLGRLGVEVQRDEDGRSDEGHGCEVLQSRVRLDGDRMKVVERMQSRPVLKYGMGANDGTMRQTSTLYTVLSFRKLCRTVSMRPPLRMTNKLRDDPKGAKQLRVGVSSEVRPCCFKEVYMSSQGG